MPSCKATVSALLRFRRSVTSMFPEGCGRAPAQEELISFEEDGADELGWSNSRFLGFRRLLVFAILFCLT